MDAAPKSAPPASKSNAAASSAQVDIDRSNAYGQLLTAVEKLNELAERMASRSAAQQHKLTKHLHALMKRFR